MGMVQVNVKSTMKQVTRDLGVTSQKVIIPAAVSAMGRAGTQARTAAKKELAKAFGIPHKVINNRLKLAKPNRKLLSFAIYWLHNPINAAYLGRLAYTKKGARAGKRVFPGTWAISRGYVSKETGKKFPTDLILKRKGKARYKTKAEKIKIWPQSDPIMNRVVMTKGGAVFRKRFTHELERRAGRRR